MFLKFFAANEQFGEKMTFFPIGGGKMKRMFWILVCLTALMSAGCSGGKWIMQTEVSEAQLFWPEAPKEPKIKYVMAVKGFKESGTSFSKMMKNIFFGGKERDVVSRPVAVATGNDGRLAIADGGCKCVHLYIPSEEKYLTLQSAKSDELRSPVGVVFDDSMRLYVSDSFHNKVFVFGKDGDFLFSMAGSAPAALQRPTGLAYNHDAKTIYVADTVANKIYAFNTSGEILFSFGKRGGGNSELNYPTYLSWSPAGRLYVTDSMNFRVQIFDSSGAFLDAFGRHGDGSGDFAMPKGIALDKDGIIYVVDALFDNVQLFDERGEFLLTVGRRGVDQGEFWLPSGIFIDHQNKLYVCDTYNRRVQIFEILGGPKMSETGGMSQTGGRN